MQIIETTNEYLAIEGYVFGSETRQPALTNNGTLFLQIQAGTRPINLVFGANVESLTQIDSFIGGTLTTPTTLIPFNYKPSSAFTTSAIVRTATAATGLGAQRGQNQAGGGNVGNGVGGSVTGRPSTLTPGEVLTLRLTNLGGAAKSLSAGIYFTEVI